MVLSLLGAKVRGNESSIIHWHVASFPTTDDGDAATPCRHSSSDTTHSRGNWSWLHDYTAGSDEAERSGAMYNYSELAR